MTEPVAIKMGNEDTGRLKVSTSTPPRGTTVIQNDLLREVKSFDKNDLSPITSPRRLKMPQLKALKDESVDKVLDGLFIGGVGGAKRLDKLQEVGITHIINASPILPCFHKDKFKYLVLDLYDDSEDKADRFFKQSNEFIAGALSSINGSKAGGVFVHCYAGVSRSSTIVIAYLMACEGMSLKEAKALVKEARPSISPNRGFSIQLEKYDKTLNRKVVEVNKEGIVEDEFGIFDMELSERF